VSDALMASRGRRAAGRGTGWSLRSGRHR
jgi:hypothetical protein